MSRWQRLALTAVLALTSPAWAQEKEKAREAPAQPETSTAKIKGRVVDEAGKPIAGVDIARLWFTDGEGKFAPHEPVKSAADGTFSLEQTFFYGRPNVLATIDPERKRGGMVVIEPKNAGEPVTIKVGPLVHYHGKYESKDLGKPVGWTNTMVFAMPGRVNNTQISDYRGKWIALEFWGYWCGPCVGGALPRISKYAYDFDKAPLV